MVLAVTAQGHAGGVDRLDRGHGVAFDAGHLHQAANRVAGQAQIVFHADFGGVFHLFRRAAQHFGQRAGGHRAGRAHFALAAHFGAGDRGVELEQNANRPGGEQKAHHAVGVGAGHKAGVVVQHGGDDAGGAVGGGGDHAAASGVFFVDCQRIQIHPVHHRQRVAQRGFGRGAQRAVELGGAAAHVHAAGQHAFALAAARHTGLHHLP